MKATIEEFNGELFLETTQTGKYYECISLKDPSKDMATLIETMSNAAFGCEVIVVDTLNGHEYSATTLPHTLKGILKVLPKLLRRFL